MIDGALVFTGHQLLLGFKYSSPTQPDVFEMARSTTGRLQGPWRLVGRPDIYVDGGTVENYEFVMVAGRWRLVATSDNLDQPWLFTLARVPDDAQRGCSGSTGIQLAVPPQPFNTGPGISSIGYEHANSAFLCATGSAPGQEVYLLYAGSDELTQFGGWGHAAIGVARSTRPGPLAGPTRLTGRPVRPPARRPRPVRRGLGRVSGRVRRRRTTPGED